MDSYFTDDKIIYYICRVRARYAKQRSKIHHIHLLSNDSKLNHHKVKSINADEALLKEILPPRKKWKKLGKKFRYKNDFQKINSIEYNAKCIIKTIQYYKKNNPAEGFVLRLNKFVSDIRRCIDDPSYLIKKPEIYPKLKEKKVVSGIKKNTCRPISIFTLKDKIIISQTNKYLTEIFDEEFYSLSHAFRSPVKGNELTTHHTSIVEILKYKEKYSGDSLWVAESDISKFYDTVSHSVIKIQFEILVQKIENSGKKIDDRAKRIFNEFIDSYNFVEDVLPKNEDPEYWRKFKILKGEFGWVKDELIKLGHYSKIESEKIGIPQGGALSGLIANLVLDHVDSQITNIKDERLLYIRFCDDMILIHPNREFCKNAVEKYNSALLDLKLVPHPFEDNLKNNANSFWKAKSKSPYRWAKDYKNNSSFPWIGFVGYEVHFNGFVRVRKRSLKKELCKQKEIIDSIIKAIGNDNRRVRKGTIIESAINRLNGMSVGRVHLWNHSRIDSDMCWVNGFKILNNNSYLKRQLRQLDKGKNHQIALLKKEVSKYIDPPNKDISNRNAPYYGKPFSYFHQTLKRK